MSRRPCNGCTFSDSGCRRVTVALGIVCVLCRGLRMSKIVCKAVAYVMLQPCFVGRKGNARFSVHNECEFERLLLPD